MSGSLPQWPQVLNTLYGVQLSTRAPYEGALPEYEAWAKEISRGMDTLTDQTICDAIRFSVDRREDRRYKGKVTARDIRIWLFAMWKHNSSGDVFVEDGEPIVVLTDSVTGNLYEQPVAMARLRSKIDGYRNDPSGMWLVICSPKNHRHCEDLEIYAKQTWGFDRSQLGPDDMPNLAAALAAIA